MKIAFCGNFSQQHCSECHWALTFEDMGHEVTRIQENETNPLDLIPKVEGHDLFFFVRTWDCLVTPDHLAIMRSMGIPSVSYHLDLFVGLQRESMLDNNAFWMTDWVFTPDGDPKSLEVFKARGINHIYAPPGVYGPECYCGIPRTEFAQDVVFIGGGSGYHEADWPYRAQLVQWLASSYGDRYGKYGYPERTVRNGDLNDLLASCKVVVGDSLCKNFTHESYVSDRITEVTGRGGFLIMPRIKGIADVMFEENKEMVFYEFGNFDQLHSLIDYYVGHDEERELIRKAGMARTIKDHTYKSRMEKVLQVVGLS